MEDRDKEFDSLLKEKLDGFDDISFEPAALAGLHYKLDHSYKSSFFKRFQSEIIHSALLSAATLIILLTTWSWKMDEQSLISDLRQRESAQSEHIARLNHRMDSIVLLQSQEVKSGIDPALYHHLQQEISRLKHHMEMSEERKSENRIVLNDSISMSEDLFTLLGDRGLIAFNQGRFVLVLDNPKANPERVYLSLGDPVTIQEFGDSPGDKEYKNLPVSVKTSRLLEKHYRNGIGVRLGSILDYGIQVHKNGDATNHLAPGGLAELTISRSVSLETGFKWHVTYFESTDSGQISKQNYPGIQTSTGSVVKAETDSKYIEFPFNLRYRDLISPETSIYLGVGYSHLFYITQEYEYMYNDAGSVEGATLRSDYRSAKARFYPGSLNLLAGVTNRLRNNQLVDIGLYYQFGQGTKGFERSEFDQFGLRAIYWIPVKE